ncbi:MAG TPA: tetratricopeptide repeat protein [Bryobacteraceae bacterium]|nr:tetratricopeptide repeat protein [Bryobacteraceae bacterium]
MTKRMYRLLPLGGIFIALAGALWAQKAPAPKSQKELEALQAWQAATDPDQRIKAIENVLTKFADTEFKIPLLEDAMQLEQRKRDFAQTIFYGERVLEADPKNAFALVTMAGEIARHVHEFDLDKEEQLAKADKYANAGLEAAKTMPKPQSNVTEEQWANARKDMQAQAYEALGQTALLRKKYDDSIANYKKAIEVQATPEPATYVRLGQAYEDSGKFDEANEAFDKAINTPNVNPQVKAVAESKKAEVAKRKAAGTKPPGAQ